MTRHQSDSDLRQQIYEKRIAGHGPWGRAVTGLLMYGHWDGPDRMDDEDEDEYSMWSRTSLWEQTGIGDLLGQEPAWRRDR